LRRREYADLTDTAMFIDTQLAASGKLHGYRWMWEKLKENGLIARKEDVRLILTSLDPDGVASRCVRSIGLLFAIYTERFMSVIHRYSMPQKSH
jgi:hypothetical protein